MAKQFDLKQVVGSQANLNRPSSLADEAANALREMILLERLPAGTPLTERELSDGLGISRTPLREAIRTLANEGLIDFSSTRRPCVANPTILEISECLQVQGSLEALAGELACVLATDKELAAIEQLHTAFVTKAPKDDPITSFKRDMAFHAAIVAAAKNKPLAETHAVYNARLWRSRYMSSQRQANRASTFKEHEEIISALMRRDEEATAAALKQHLKTAITNIKQAFKEREEEVAVSAYK